MSSALQVLSESKKVSERIVRIRECRNSTLSVQKWCEANHVCTQTYYWWQKRLLEMARAQQNIQFAVVTLAQSVRSRSVAMTVRIAGVDADIHSGADAATLETVLRILKPCCPTSTILIGCILLVAIRIYAVV